MICKVIYTCTIFFLFSCSQKWETLSGSTNNPIKYSKSKKYGTRIMADLQIGITKYTYEIEVTAEGIPLHIIRYTDNIAKKQDNYNFFRSMEFLVTDTIGRNPSYLGNRVNGYYHDPTVINNLASGTGYVKLIKRVDSREYLLFDQIKVALSSKNLELYPVDSTKVIGWFKYDI